MNKFSMIIVAAAVFMACDKKQTENTAQEKQTEKAIPANAVAANDPNKKPELNPPHGEPFHRCDIEVGAPIDSEPKTTPAPQMMPQANSVNSGFNTNPIPQSAPVTTSQSVGPKPALNPPHGEPHHRCDLQVGAPLT